MKCTNCNEEVSNYSTTCPYCGKPIEQEQETQETQQTEQTQYPQHNHAMFVTVEENSLSGLEKFLYFLLGFFFGLIGIIPLALIDKEFTPRVKWTVIGTVSVIVASLLFTLLFMFGGFLMLASAPFAMQ